MRDLALSFVWWFVVIPVLLLTTLILSTAVLFSCHGHFASKRLYKNIHAVPTRPLLTYWEWFRRIFKQESPRAFIMRMVNCLCTGYSRQRIIIMWLGFRPIILFFKPETVEALLNNSKTISKSAEYNFLKPWLGNGLLLSTGDKWRSQRKLLTPAFHYSILENFLTTFNEEAAALTKQLALEVGKPWFDIVPTITMFTLDAICQTAMGVQLNFQSGGCKDYVEKIHQISDVFLHRLTRPWLWPDIIFNNCSSVGRNFCKNVQAIHEFTRKVIKEKKECLLRENDGEHLEEDSVEGKKRKKKAFLELLLELHLKDESFTEENIREEVDTFMFEGHDTTAMAISWTLYLLGQHPEIQEKVYQELDEIFAGDREREVTSEDLKQMKYLECVIKETLRLFPPVPFVGRQLTETLEFDHYSLAPGASCGVCIYMLHRDPEQFPEPEIFDPDRFLPENSQGRHPYAYIPFSAGPRNCIGQRFAMMEEKTALTHILRKFRITSLDPRDTIETMFGLVLKSKDPVRICIHLR